MNKKIWFVFDIDGVITDGCVSVDQEGEEHKRINLKDIDAIYELAQRGYSLAAVTSEANGFTEWVKDRFPWNQFYSGAKHKSTELKQLRAENQIEEGGLIYIGDGKKDLSAFEEADWRICPSDAIKEICSAADFILSRPSGAGALWELIEWSEKRLSKPRCTNAGDANAGCMLWQEIVQDHSTLLEAVKLDSYLTQTLLEIADAITNALSTNRRVLLFGNGGSAADAQHLAAEFIGRFQKERCAWDVEALTVNTSILTAVANDYGFEVVFARQIQAIVRPKDVVIGLSTSGRSKNVAAALHAAKQQGGITVLMTGRNGFCDDADLTLNIPSDNTARIQEMHILAGHFLAQAVELRLTQ